MDRAASVSLDPARVDSLRHGGEPSTGHPPGELFSAVAFTLLILGLHEHPAWHINSSTIASPAASTGASFQIAQGC